MKYIFQFTVILAISFIAEICYNVFKLPIPASIYGLIIMLFLLMTKVIKLEWVRESSKYLIAIMPIMFIPAGVKLMTMADLILPIALPIGFILLSTTIIVMAISGKATELVIKIEERFKAKKEKKKSGR